MNHVPDVPVGGTQVGHRKTHDVTANVPDVPDVTPNRRGCTWRASASARARPLGLIDTPLSNGVTSVTSVTPPLPYGGFSVTRNRDIGDHVTVHGAAGVKA